MHLYLHIPFCRQACHYCDFHFSTQLAGREALIDALVAELRQQRHYLPPGPLRTVYLGGGTPSLLSEAELARLFETIHAIFSLEPTAEITLEANPDDLDAMALQQFRNLGINRLSIGIQSFDAGQLRYLNRIHTADEAAASVRRAQEAGFENISVDLIYGIPASSDAPWQRDLEAATALGVPHISAYCLTIEPQTVFGNWLKNKKIAPIDDERAARHFAHLTAHLAATGYEQYEISNFAQPGRHSRHNTSYWQGEPYLGIGPSAHSFDGQITRQANLSHNTRYVQAIGRGEIPATVEVLSPADRVNEYLLTSLRTHWGCDLGHLRSLSAAGHAAVEALLPAVVAQGWLSRQGEVLRLTEAGKLFADRIASDLFWLP